MLVARKTQSFFAVFILILAAWIPSAFAQVPWPPSPLVKLAVNPVTNKVYLLNEADDTVTVLNAATNTTTTIPVGDRPAYIAVNPATNRIYVNNAGDSSLTVIDGATDTNLTPTPLALGTLGPLAINPVTNIVYIVRLTGPSTDEVTFFNGNDHGWYTIATQSFQPIMVTVNPATNTLYVPHYSTGDVRVISAAMDGNDHPTTVSVGVWSKPFAIAANPVTNKVYVLTEDSRGPIAIINGANPAAGATFPAVTPGHAVGPKNLAINTVTNKIYAAFNDEVIVIDGATGALTYIPVATGTGPAEVGINHHTNQVYVANSSGTLTIIDGATNATSTVSIPSGVNSLGVNPITNEVFVFGDGGVTVVDGVGTASAVPLTATITPKPSDTTTSSTSFTITATSSLLPVRKVYYQLDSREGAWTAATGSGPFTASFTGLSVGTHTLYAFATDGQDAPLSTGAQSNPLVGTIASYTFTVSGSPPPKADPTVSLGSSKNPATAGETVTFTATVTGSVGTPTGSIEFRNGASAIVGCGAVALVSGSATCSTGSLGVGTHSITAAYGGDSAYNTANSGAVSQVIQAAPVASSTALASSRNPAMVGESITFTATVSGGSGTPAGTVDFRDGGVAITGCTGLALSGGGTATCTTSGLSQGAHSITARYSGSASYEPSTSATLPQMVNAPVAGTPTNVALASAGSTATASSNYGAGSSPSALINNERAGANWGNGGGWEDATYNAYPDWVQVQFDGAKTIDRVVVYTLANSYGMEPTDTSSASSYGVRDFTVEGWTGSAWQVLGSVSGNTLAKRTVTFNAFTTDRIRINITAASYFKSRLVEVEAWGVPATMLLPSNVALASAGATATASSNYGTGSSPAAVIDNQRSGANWGNGGGWEDGTYNAYPDWVQVQFGGNKRIDRVVVYTLSDSYGIEPTDTSTASSYGIRDFTVEGWNGTSWQVLATVTGNTLAKRTVTFDAFTTDRIRINVSAAAYFKSRIVEVEAWGVDAGGSVPVSNVALASTGATATASSTGSGKQAAFAIDNERAGTQWWEDGTYNSYPDWLQVQFNGARTIDRVVVYTLSNTYGTEPTDTTSASTYGISSFTVEAWNGSGWDILATVTGNTLAKRTVTFTPVSTERIRINVTAAAYYMSRIVEVEAWGY